MPKESTPLTLDALAWAESFVAEQPDTLNPDTMIGWFANALMRGYDAAKAEGVWEDADSIDPTDYSELECKVATALAALPPFDGEVMVRALPFARIALAACDEWEKAATS